MCNPNVSFSSKFTATALNTVLASSYNQMT
jgi:hypothetical protein